MKVRKNDFRREISIAPAAIIILSLFLSVMPVSGVPTVVREIEPSTVSAGDVVDVTIEFTTTSSNLFLIISDYVPIGWPVTDLSANIAPAEATFDSSTGKVSFRWNGIPISAGTHVVAEYKLHVPAGAGLGDYILDGDLQQSAEPQNIPITVDDTVCVKSSYEVMLRADSAFKVTDANVDVFYYITVENRGANTDTYSLIVNTQADFAGLSQPSVTLGSGESDTIVLRVYSYLAGEYDTTVEAVSTEASDELTVTTRVEPFYDVLVDVSPAEKQVQTNDLAMYTVVVANQGNTPDIVDLSILDFGVSSTEAGVFRQLSDDTFALGVDEDATAYFNITSAVPGTFEKTVKASSQGDHLVSDAAVVTLIVEPRTAAAVPTVTRSIDPDTVNPGGVVDVTIEFTTTDKYLYLYLSDNVPEGWHVPEESMTENSGLPAYLVFQGFDTTEGEVSFKWIPIEPAANPGMPSGTHLIAQYELHVPADAEPGSYNLQGDLTVSTDLYTYSIAFVGGETSVNVGGVIPPTKGDFNGDGNINWTDFLVFADAYGSSEGDATYDVLADFDNDGDVDWTDFLMFADVYGT